MDALIAAGLGFLLPALLMGATVPLAMRWFRHSCPLSGQSAGVVAGANTVGAAIGPVVAGFVLVPLLGIHRSIVALAALNTAVGLTLLLAARPGFRLRLPSAAAVAAVALVIGVQAWHRDPVSDYAAGLELHEIIAIEQGSDCTVTITKGDDGDRSLSIDGAPMAITGPAMRFRAHLAMLLHPDPRRVLVIGFGTGTTVGTVAERYPGVRVRCVELAPTVLRCGHYFQRWNHDVLHHPRATFRIEDARAYVACSAERYDVIVSDPPHPFGAHAATLYSRDFYEACYERLEDGGVFLQWVPVLMSSERDLKTMVRTFARSFSHFTMWSGGPASMHLVATRGPLRISLSRLAKRMKAPGIASDLRGDALDGPRRLLGRAFLADANATLQWAGEGPVITDDRPTIEFTIPRWFRDPRGRSEVVQPHTIQAFRTSPGAFVSP